MIYNELQNRTCLITGATGMIGSRLVSYIHEVAPECHVITLVRSLERAQTKLGQYDWLTYLQGDIAQPIVYEGDIDYIIHGASITSSKAFVEQPVDTILTSINGTRNILDLAVKKKVKSVVYLSTMEIYGAPESDERIDEQHSNNINPMIERSSYPESKRACEALCAAYHAQYDVPVKVARLTQTIGPGISYNDGRVFAEFARCVVEKKDIVLHTAGKTKRMYISTDDAVKAILTLLLYGENGEAYNIANEETYCSVYEMAVMVAEQIANRAIGVQIQEEDGSKYGYAPTLCMNLDTKKIKELGWNAKDSLEEMYQKLVRQMKEHCECNEKDI